jgi:PAS domain S-box-containing protein
MRWFSFSSLRMRIALLIFLAMVPVLGLALNTYLQEREIAISGVEEEVQRTAQYAAGTQEQLIEGTRQLLVALSSLRPVDEHTAKICSERFADMLSEYPTYANLGATLTDGTLFCSASGLHQPLDISNQTWFKQSVKTGDFAIGVSDMSGEPKKPALVFSYPISDDNGNAHGVVFAVLTLDVLNQITSQVQLPEKAEFIMTYEDGTIVSYLPDSDRWVGKTMRDAQIIKTILTKGQDVTEGRGMDGVSRLYAFTPLHSTVDTGLYLCIGIPTSLAYSDANTVLLHHLVGLGLVTLLALLAVWFGGDVFILRRVNALVSASKRLSRGDMKARTGLRHGTGELDQLARAFDEMAEALEDHAVQLRGAEAKYRTLVEQMPVVIYTARLDSVRTPIYISPQLESMLGFTPDEWTAEAELWVKRIHPEDLEQVLVMLESSLSEKKPFRAEYRLFARDGRLMWFSDEAVIVQDHASGSAYLQGTMRDITEARKSEEALRESEERFRLLVECVKDYAIFMLDPQGSVVSWNTGTERLKGYSADEIIGGNYSSFYSSEDRKSGVPARDLDAAKANGSFENEGWRVRKDGSSFWADAMLTALYDKRNRLIGFSCITRDLTEHKLAEEKLLKYQEQLRSLASQLSLAEERERRRIAIELHDRVGQALAMSKIRLGVLKHSLPASDLKPSVDEIRKLIEEAIQDTRSLIFKISSPILYELGFEAALEWLAEQLQKQHGIQAGYEDDRLPKPLDDDIRVILFQATSELLVNVAKHAGASRVKVSSRREGDRILVSVEDDGVGFDASKIGSHWRSAVGFGLFSISERLKCMNGHVEIESEPGSRTCVTLVAPLRLENEKADSIQLLPERSAGQAH